MFGYEIKKKKKWSPKYGDECYDCGESKRKHISKGLCTTCYARWLYQNSPSRREQVKASSYNWMKNNPERWKEIQNKAMERYRKKHKLFTGDLAKISVNKEQ